MDLSRLVSSIRRRVAPVHRMFRHHKLALLFRVLEPRPSDTLVDLGGGYGIDNEFEPMHHFFREVLLVNLDAEPARIGSISTMRGDARALPYPNRSFDWVFSNAVIEHVGNWEEQRRMAHEVRRVARKGYFVATPNFYFPIDPHTFLPLRHYWKQSSDCWMLTKQQMKLLFPEAVVRIVGVGTSIVAYHCRFQPS